MLEQIHRFLGKVGCGTTFEQFFMQLINGMQVTRDMAVAAVLKLSTQKDVQIPGEDGGAGTRVE